MLEVAPSESASERELVERAIGRDGDAFAALYDRHATAIYRRLYKLVGNAPDAEDLTAQVFLQAWQAIDRFELRGAPFVSWLMRIAHNLAVSHLRRHRDHAQLPEAAEGPGSRQTNPEEAVQRLLDEERVLRALQNLGREQRLVVALRELDNLDYREVAAILGKSVPAVRVIRHRAINALRRQMAPDAQMAGA
ncbi:MAG: sigma-70 family RNA polymerase sigma factor [Dehalococcoidia bacterium]